MFTRPPGNDSWLGRLLKLYKVLGEGEGDLQKTAVLDIHIKFSLSNLKSVADSVCMFGPRWFKLLKGAQSLINPSLQSEFHLLPACQSSCLRLLSLFCIAEFRSVVYWHLGLFIARRWWRREQGWRSPQPFQVWWWQWLRQEQRSRQSKNNLLIYQWWALGVAFTSILVWALGAYSGILQRSRLLVSQFEDCVLWLGSMWCMAAFFLWTARIIISLIPVSGSHGNCWNLFKSENALFVTREFVANLKLDEWMAHNGWLCRV